MTTYYDRNGKEMSLTEWAEAFENVEYRIIGSHSVGDLWVSTVWLGLDLDPIRFIADDPAPPMIFESMIFVVPQGDDRWLSLEMRRYRTEHDAMIGHTEFVHLANLMVDVEKEVTDDVGSSGADVRSEGDTQ